jgi:8-oxo-dGTP pyrophosphatase MutT (NUDIX family)
MTAQTTFDETLPERLSRRLAQPLPGRAVQRELEPDLSFGRHYAPPASGARDAAVIALLYPAPDGWQLPLMLRPQNMASHAGQVSFPGGAVESGESSWDAALRELHEELGIVSDGIQLLGRLTSLYVFASNFMVSPWVAVLDEQPRIRINPAEVDEVLEVSLAHLADPANRGTHLRHYGEVEFSAPHFAFEQHQIWGATSMMLAELIAVARQA